MMNNRTLVNRRSFLKGGVGAAALALSAPTELGAMLQAAAEPKRLAPGPQLFIDDWLIAGQSNLSRVIQPPPTRLPEPIVTAADKCFQPYVSVIRDPQTKRFRLYYNTAISSTRSHIGYMESDDGMSWIRPFRELENPSGQEVGFGAYVVDDGPGFADQSRRYKLAWEKDGLYIAFSPDGLKWTSAGPERTLGGIGDIISLSRDPIRKRYLLLCKVNSRPEDGYKGSTPNAAEGTRRLVGQSVSDDCIHWSPAQRIIAADAQDEGITEFYSIGQVIARGGLLIGLLKVLRDDLSPEPGGEQIGIGYTVLAWTRDGQTWHRDRESFMDRNAQPGSWDRAMTWGDCLLPVDDEVFIYYGGYARGHKVERFKERQIGFARMKRDRFVARRAGADGGVLRTPPLVLEGSGITINADIKGEARVAMLDATGRPLPGHASADAVPMRGDSLAHAVRWKSSPALVKGLPVQIEFHLRDASLFSFEVQP
jgi:TAT (twin-arginine translocation) pathway signal sequence